MRPEEFREFLRREPFRPFRVTLTDGRIYDVVHPELGMVGRSTVVIGVPRKGVSEPIYDRSITVSLLHIMQIELLETAATA